MSMSWRGSSANTLYVVLRDPKGQVAHQAIGSAILEADWDGRLAMFAMRKGTEPLASFYADSPLQAEGAKRTLADVGDVDFDDRDFDPKWFKPADGIDAVDGLLHHGREGRHRLPEPVRAELALLRRTLVDAACRSYTFHLVEVEPGEDLGFAGPQLDGRAG